MERAWCRNWMRLTLMRNAGRQHKLRQPQSREAEHSLLSIHSASMSPLQSRAGGNGRAAQSPILQQGELVCTACSRASAALAQAGAPGSHSSTIHCDLLVLLLLMSRKVTEIWVAAGRVGQCRVQGQQAAALGRSRLHAQPRLVPS